MNQFATLPGALELAKTLELGLRDCFKGMETERD